MPSNALTSPTKSLLFFAVLSIVIGLFLSPTDAPNSRDRSNIKPVAVAASHFETRMIVRSQALATGCLMLFAAFLLGMSAAPKLLRDWTGAMTGLLGFLTPLSLLLSMNNAIEATTAKGIERAALTHQFVSAFFLLFFIASLYLSLHYRPKKVTLQTDRPDALK